VTRGLRRLLNRTLTVTRRGDVTSTSRGGIPVYEPLELGLVKGRIEAVGLGGRPIQQTEITTSPNLEPVVSDFHAVTELNLLPATPAEISGGAETALDGATLAGADEVTVDSAAGIGAGTWLRIGAGTTEEHREVTVVAGTDLTLAQALLFAHADDTAVVEIEEPPAPEALDLTERDVLSDDTGVYDVLSVARADGRARPHHYEAKLRKVTA
jgi:hypothetical protein